MAFQFKIQIKGITKPPVWRKVVVPENFTFLRFHEVIQAAFGWDNYHLFEFADRVYDSDIRIALPAEDDFWGSEFLGETEDASKVKLSDIFVKQVHKLVYIYDFGDNWVHEITLESVLSEKPRKAVCLLGKGTCPPEDCGGIYGYEEMKKTFQTMPESEEAYTYREWLGMEEDETWDANEFDINEANAFLKFV